MKQKRILFLISLLLVLAAESHAVTFQKESERTNTADLKDAAIPLNFQKSQEKSEESIKPQDNLFETLEMLRESTNTQTNTISKEQYPSFLSDNQNSYNNQTLKITDSQTKKTSQFPKKFPNMGLGPQLRMKTDIRNKTEIRNSNL